MYTLGALAQLYEAAGVNLDQALELARANLQYRRDAQAEAIYQAVRRRLGGTW